MKDWDMGHGTWDMGRGTMPHGQRGQAIVEYLLVAAAAIAAVAAVSQAVGWRTLIVAVRELNRVNGIPWQ